ncbi:MAG: YbgC/FadM family acyl-CoA thioesterase [Deltaproteobacteria bacterium]|nr:YbgC/FadM family acyl-CoA thioesterase [Deltaproteobacteria bacterium]
MIIPVRIYYEDTDTGGVVYYANYLKYFERGRTEYLREKGIELEELHKKGIVFVVVRAEADYLSPAKYGDLLHVKTELKEKTGATITFSHEVTKAGSDAIVARGLVQLACVGEGGRPLRLPREIANII